MSLIIGTILSIIGIIGTLIGALILLPKIFIPKEELELLSKLPVEPSTSHMTSSITHKTLPVTVTDVKVLIEYKELYIKNRKKDTEKGKKGFIFLIGGSLLQILGIIIK
ncbi:MAG: hypothetical protein HY919_08310 [Elusimicrobia bacterium]|nr:hypothetical protein [Elusimicrobiota bacterium]